MFIVQIDPKQRIAGVPILSIRDFLQRAEGGFLDSQIADRLHVSPAKAKAVVAEMAKASLIVWKDDHWTLSVKGAQLRLAKGSPRIRRSTADRLIEEL